MPTLLLWQVWLPPIMLLDYTLLGVGIVAATYVSIRTYRKVFPLQSPPNQS